MSVINDMLRDLDKRQAPEVSGAEQPIQESLIEPQSSVYKKWLVLVGGLLIVMTLVYVLLDKNSDSATVQVPVMNAGLKSTPEKILVTDSKKEEYKERAIQARVENQEILKKDTDNTVKPESIALTINKQEAKVQRMQSKSLSEDVAKQPLTQNEPSIKKEPSNKPVVAVNEAALSAEHVIIKADNSSNRIPVDTKPVSSNRSPAETNTMAVTLSPIALDQKMAEKATKLLAQQQELAAYRQLYQFIGEHDEDTESRTVLASYLLKENRIAEAGDVLLNAPISTSPKLRQIKARWYVAQGQHKLAIYTLVSELPNIEVFPDYYVLLAAYYQRYGSAKEASQTYALLVDYDESVADWWAGLGLAADRSNEKEKAIFAYQQALDLTGLTPELLNFVKPRLQQLLASLPSIVQPVAEKK